ncbi:MAG: hypothetical protein J6Z07_03900 [Lachnospiraceae bacterium]|nr:hypothetical protein [Lachnospiraceae bacterium]
MDEKARYEFVQQQVKAMKTSYILWWIVLGIQGLISLSTMMVVYGFLVLAVFIFNIVFCYHEVQYYKSVEACGWEPEDVLNYMQKTKKRSLIMLIPNLIFGAGVGCIGNIYDLVMANKALKQKKEIIGDADLNDLMKVDPNIDWDHCAICNKTEADDVGIYKLKDGAVCSDCMASHEGLVPQRAENSLYVKKRAHFVHMDVALLKVTVDNLKERFENFKKNQEMYPNFTPTKVLYDGCLELDENNSLFRIAKVWNDDFTSTQNGFPSGLVHPYSEVTGVCYEMIHHYYETEDSETHTKSGSWVYTDRNSIVIVLDNKYMTEETFLLKKIETSFFNFSKKPHVEYAEKVVKEISEIFGKPVMNMRIVENRNFSR